MPQPFNIGTFVQWLSKIRDNSKYGQVSLGSDLVYSQVFSATLAEVNAGKVLVVGIPGHYAVPVGFTVVPTGTFTTSTSIDLVAGSVNIASFPIAGVTNGAKLVPESAGTTLGAGFDPLTMQTSALGQGISIAKTGSTAAGGTSILVRVKYKLVAG